ncbi:hypothetical protein [Helicobacter cinaedi]|uniref:hypothetical protein n=1 Tax=Helicobacter cinaedi TaxID=213 RepID=UPI000D7D1ED8|nr:hypothetical protein [Helicobacter cinaedi]
MQYLIVFLSIIIFTLGGSCAYLLNKNAELKTLNQINSAVVEHQTKAIEQMALESEKYHCDLESMNDYTREKYSKVVTEHKDESCESKLKAFEEALHIYGGR